MQNNNIYKDLNRINKLKTSPSTNTFSFIKNIIIITLTLFNNLFINPTPTNPTLYYF